MGEPTMTQQGQGNVVALIRERVFATVCPTHRFVDGEHTETQEGRISAADFGALLSEIDRLRTLLSSSRGEQGWRNVSVPADRIIACRDAFIRDDHAEAYHQLRMMVDPECAVHQRTGDHWTDVQSVAEGKAPGSVPTSLAGQVPDPDEYRDTFSGIVQGNCEDCGDCSDDKNGECACDRIVNELIAAVERINEEAAPQPTAGGDAPSEWTEGVCEDGAAILRDGQPISISGVLAILNRENDALSAERARVIATLQSLRNSLNEALQVAVRKGIGIDWDAAQQEALRGWNEADAALRALGQQDTGGKDHG